MSGIASILIGLKARRSAAPFERATLDPEAAQEALLRRMMAANRDTERGKRRLVAEGKRLFQAKTVLLDAKQGYRPEPGELEAEVDFAERLGGPEP